MEKKESCPWGRCRQRWCFNLEHQKDKNVENLGKPGMQPVFHNETYFSAFFILRKTELPRSLRIISDKKLLLRDNCCRGVLDCKTRSYELKLQKMIQIYAS